MEWTTDKCLRLIDLYEEEKVLWDSKNPAYFSKQNKNKAWKKIADILDVSEEEVKRKMNSLLGSFRRERAKQRKSILTATDQNEFYTSKWFAFQRMHFLLEKAEPMESIFDLTGVQHPIIAEETDELSLSEYASERGDGFNEGISVKSESDYAAYYREGGQPYYVPQVKRRRKQEESLMDVTLQLLQKKTLLEDECSAFGQYVANKLRSYSSESRSRVEHLINDILFDADMGKYGGSGNSDEKTARLRPGRSDSSLTTPPYDNINSRNTVSESQVRSPSSSKQDDVDKDYISFENVKKILIMK